MSGYELLLMAFSNFFAVFLLGIQSKNVVHGHYFAAIVTSFGISTTQFIFVKLASVGTIDAFAAAAFGGCAGIAFSIYFYDKVIRKHHERKRGGK